MPLQNFDHFKAIYLTLILALAVVVGSVVWESSQITTNKRDISELARGQIQLQQEEHSQLGMLGDLMRGRQKAEQERRELLRTQKEILALLKRRR
jgi:hypothetical protein